MPEGDVINPRVCAGCPKPIEEEVHSLGNPKREGLEFFHPSCCPLCKMDPRRVVATFGEVAL